MTCALPQAYTTDERAEREIIFAERLRRIVEHNADASQTWKKGVNEVRVKCGVVAQFEAVNYSIGWTIHSDTSIWLLC